MCCAGNRWVQSLWNDGRPIHLLAHVRYPPQSPPDVLFQRQNIFLSLIIPEHPENNMSVYMEPLIDDLIHDLVRVEDGGRAAKDEGRAAVDV